MLAFPQRSLIQKLIVMIGKKCYLLTDIALSQALIILLQSWPNKETLLLLTFRLIQHKFDKDSTTTPLRKGLFAPSQQRLQQVAVSKVFALTRCFQVLSKHR